MHQKKLCAYQEERPFYSALGTHSEALVTYKNYVIFTCSFKFAICRGGWKHNLNMLGHSLEPQKEEFFNIIFEFVMLESASFMQTSRKVEI